MNLKVILIGGLAYYAAQWAVGMVTGPLIHNGILVEAYQATAGFWRPELMKDPPDMAALLPLWITTGLIGAFLSAAIYMWVRPALSGAAWQRGLKFGVIALVFQLIATMGFQGVSNLPMQIWAWWCVEAVALLLVGGVALGWVAQKLAPANN
jgi:hypothetical protein